MLRKSIMLVMFFGAASLAQHSLAGDASGRAIGATCNGCHGTNGISQGAAPSIKGLPEAYLDQTMQQFKSGARPGTIMGRIAKGYSDAEIAAVSKYFAELK